MARQQKTANVLRARTMHNSTHWKRCVHADGQNRMQCVIKVIARVQWTVHTWHELQVDTKQISHTGYNSE